MNHSTLGGAAAILAFSFATTACSTAPTTPLPRLATAAVGDSSSSPCRVTGRPVVLAKRVFAPGGVEVLVRDAGFDPVVVGKLADAVRFQRGAAGYGQAVTATELKQKLSLAP